MRALTLGVVVMIILVQPAEPTGAAAIMESLLYGFEMAPPSRTTNTRPPEQD